MADAVATWSLDLEDNTSNAAISAAKALEQLRDTITKDTRALADMQRAMKNLQQGNVVNVAQYRQLKAAIDAKKQSIAQAQSSFLSLGGTFGKTGKSSGGLAAQLQALQRTAQGVPGPIQGIAGAVGNLGQLLSKGGVALGFLAVAAAMIAVTAAAVAGTAALLKYGIVAMNARRAEGLRMEGLTKMRNWWGIAAGNSKEMQTQLDRVSASTALGRDKLEGYQRQLYQMGLRGENLGFALEAASIKGAALGEEGAKSAMHWAAGLALAGGSVRRLRDDVVARFGKVASAMMLDLDVQTQKLKENFSQLFTGLRIEGLLKAVNMLTSLLSGATASGQGLKRILTGLLNPLIAAMEYLAPYAKRFWQGLIVGGLLFTIAVLRVRKYLREAFDTDALAQMDLTMLAFYAGIAAVAGFVAMLALAIVTIGVGLVAALILATPYLLWMSVILGVMAIKALVLAAPFILVGLAILTVIAFLYQLYRLWKEIPWDDVGKWIVDGLWKGITEKWDWFVDAVTGLSSDLINSIKDTLGISSPSKVFAGLGEQIPAGFAQGVERGSGKATKATADMATASAAAGDRGGPTRGNGSAAVTINVGGIHVEGGGSTAPELATNIEAALIPVFERLALQLGQSPA